MKSKNIRRKFAVTPIIGTLLILGITTSSFGVVYFSFGNSNQDSGSSSIVDISAIIENDQVIITHRGGDLLDLDTKLLLNIGDNSSTIRIGDYLDEQSKDDGAWSLGEQIFYPYDFNDPPYPNLDIIIIND